jgi:CRISPR/Cas system-associated exonuclease Cas4 (RecB family)
MSPPLLPADFQFSQASLQDYVDCRRRFQLRYLLELAWPAIEAEPADEYEAQLRQGEAFHRLVHQHQAGVPAELLTKMAGSEDPDEAGRLQEWWTHYLEDAPDDLPKVRYSEVALSAPLGNYRLVAKYDLIAVEPGQRAVIVDWKTSQARTAGAWLAARLQTRVYRYLLVRAGASLNGGRPLEPAQVEMIYWFANYPAEPERMPYDETMYRADERYLETLIAEIAHAEEGDFPLTDDARRCRFCTYRSLCDRGVEAGEIPGAEGQPGGQVPAAYGPRDEPPDDLERLAGFDFEQIGEVAY